MIFRKFFNKDADKIGEVSQKFNLPPRIAELILSRGIVKDEDIQEFLNPTTFHDPFLLNGMKELVQRVQLAKALGDKVLIFGDYDVDGVSATAIMLKALAKMGIDANYYLPNRYVDGYGLTNAVIDKIYNLFEPNLIITVDCGISCYNEVEYAKSKGIEVIVTDHHEIPEVLPDTIVLNAKIEGQAYPFRELCGTGMAFKVAQALLGKQEAEEFLPIAALATIADIVPLLDENRTIVTMGLAKADKLPKGIKALFKEFGISVTKPSSTDISFKISPKINASGRMGDAQDSLRLYLENDPAKIAKYINLIKGHNTKRQEICNKIYADCEKALQKIDMRSVRVICLASKVWDQGVLGIVCSRIVEKYNRPTFLFAQEGEYLRGSGRSIDDINIHELISSLKDILETFGGHSMAVGLSLKRDKYQEFIQRVNAFTFQHVSDNVFMPISYYDQEITAEEVTPEFVKSLDILQPFGCANPVPLFKITTQDVDIKPMKRFPQHANIKIGNLDLVYFNYLENAQKIRFSRQKSFIFSFKDKNVKGIVEEFDGGSFITEDAHKNLNPLEISQLSYNSSSQPKYTMYTKNQLLSFVSKTSTSVFGTCFVTFSGYDYVDFSRNYNTQGIYHFGICDKYSGGFNSLLLSPQGLDWAKNFDQIVFLSPVLDTQYIAALSISSGAEIFLPMDRNVDYKKFSSIDLSRQTFARIYSALSAKKNKTYNTIFELFDEISSVVKVSFSTFYSALATFQELGFISIIDDGGISVKINKQNKKELTCSKVYSKLCAFQQAGQN